MLLREKEKEKERERGRERERAHKRRDRTFLVGENVAFVATDTGRFCQNRMDHPG